MQSLEGLDFVDRMTEVSKRMQSRLDKLTTEEATKNALVMPFINHILGYNVFDPSEVMPEFAADVGTKKREKVDYALLQDGSPVMLFECKRHGTSLDNEPASQLYRYFSVTKARFGVLTDGVIYRFFSDLDEKNKMDPKPFFEIDMLDFSDGEVEELRRFTKTSFDPENILSTAKDLKYTREIILLLLSEWAEPSEAFVRHITGQVYDGSRTKNVIDQFSPIVKKAMGRFLTGRINERLKSALEEPVKHEDETPLEPNPTNESSFINQDEWQGYFAVKAILTSVVSPERVQIRSMKHCCAVLLDGTNRKVICRLRFRGSTKTLGLYNQGKAEEKIPIETVDDVFTYSNQLMETARIYE
jgi:hypothetical protein